MEEGVERSYISDRVEEAVLAREVAWLDKVVLERGAHGTALEADTRVRGGVGGGSEQQGGCCEGRHLDGL